MAAKKKENIRPAKSLTKKRNRTRVVRTMQTIIIDRAEELGLNPYKVAKLVTGKMTPQAVYNYLAKRQDVSSTRAFHLAEALGLEIRPVSGDTKPRKS